MDTNTVWKEAMDTGAGLERLPTFWEKAVGLSFNPGGMESVNVVKELFAAIIDIINPAEPEKESSYMSNNLKWMATRACIMAQMAVVKFLTWKD